VVPPRPQHREISVLDEQGTAQLLGDISSPRLRVAALLAVTTGLRRGEVLGLTWSDIDFRQGFISVSRAIEQTKDGVSVKEPKWASRRRISLPAFVAKELKRLRKMDLELRLQLGTQFRNEAGLIFADAEGSLWRPSALTSAFRKLMKRRSESQRVRLHDLRHSHASQLLAHDVHPKIVQERLGHSSIKLTMDTYSHLLPGLQERAAQQIDAALGSAIKRSRVRQGVSRKSR
jgi:integrase